MGLAIGDALGTTLEFSSPGTFDPIQDMVGGGPFRLKPGQWTDDTSMALCLAQSLIDCQGFDPKDQMTRYVRWYQEGYMSSTGRCFDIGNTISAALHKFMHTGEPFSGSLEPRSAGNGSLMRLAPAPLFYAQDPEQAILYAGESSRTTHGTETTVDACRYMAALLVGVVQGVSKQTVLSPRYSPLADYWTAHPLCPEIDAVAAGSFITNEPPQIKGTGFVVKALEAALWAFHRSDNFQDGCLMAVNLGDDADTTGAIYGQLAGCYYGFESLPKTWVEKIAWKEGILDIAKQLHAQSMNRA